MFLGKIKGIIYNVWTEDKVNLISILITYLYKVLRSQIIEKAP